MRVGLTGNFGMGKSTVMAMFRELGALTVSTDEIVADLLTEPDIIDKVREVFGDDVVPNGRIDKRMLSEIVFSDARLRIALEDVLHPMVFSRVEGEISRISRGGVAAPVIIEAPVLFERGYQNRFDRIITVFAGEDVAISRLGKKGVSEAEVRKRFGSQFPIEKKKAGSDYVIDNSGQEGDTREQVIRIYDELMRTRRTYGNN